MIVIGNLSLAKMEKRLKITLRDDHRDFLEQTLKDGKWQCFKHPFVIVGSSEEFSEKIWNILRQYPITVPFMVGYTTKG